MQFNFKEDKIFIYSIIFILSVASILRFYNLNFDDLWADEIFSFWIADPRVSLSETLNRAFSSSLNFFYDVGLKYFHMIFDYDVYVSRYFSLLISILSLILFAFLLLKITSKESVIFGIFILSINLYHIKYSQELRSYILTFFFTLIFILFNFKGKETYTKFKIFNFLTSIIIVFLMYCNHAFTILIVGSFVFYEFLRIVKEKKINKNSILLILSYVCVTLIFLIFYYQTTLKFVDPDTMNGLSLNWLELPKASFYTNFYFSEFFGSRLLGLIHLSVLLFCIFKFRKEIFSENFNIFTFFVFLIFFSYFIPLIYGYLFGPVLLGRYLVFLLIPIIFLLSHFIFKIKNRTLKYFFIILIAVTTTVNHFLYENTFRQFYTKPFHTKPQVKQSFDLINDSDIKFLTIKMLDEDFNHTNDVYENYVVKYLEKKELDIYYYNYQKNNIQPYQTWMLYFRDITNDDFVIPHEFENYEISQKKNLNRLTLVKLRKITNTK
ncbi:hypothetical protein [Candidatus Pelagibacter sp. FZCC0015]|uniref:hypothetical protein n=1 Tax=Candidatus Pelagibacter sp. FZCC0015 TaxID=2268451 RepID=UPI0011A87DD0|nr:hypothetical protein [Candidatus Pelagibacter sp. FZCC0015]